MKLAVFGCGYIYQKYKHLIPECDDIIVILNNDVTFHGKEIDGHVCIYPREILRYDVDRVVIFSKFALEMRQQLLQINFSERKIMHYLDYLGELRRDSKLLLNTENISKQEKRLLIISNTLGYHGGAMVSLRAGLAAQKIGYRVDIAASDGDKEFLKEITECGINVIIQKDLENSSQENLEWTKEYDNVIVNTFSMVLCAIKIAKYKKICLWIHESPDLYQEMEYWHNEIQEGLINNNIEMVAVTERAVENLLRFYIYNNNITILPAPIDDCYEQRIVKRLKSESDVFNILLCGAMTKNKGYELSIMALNNISFKQRRCLYVVGKKYENDFSKKIMQQLEEREDCHYLGEKSTKELIEVYSNMDLVIVPSQEETFSMVAAEAMMMELPCAVSDHCGIAQYIENGVNGFIFPRNDTDALTNIIIWCMNNREELKTIGYQARKGYISHFSSGVFEYNLRDLLARS